MAIATGVAKRVAYKKETTYGVLPGQTAAQSLRRTESSLNLTRDPYESQEIREDYQTFDMRLGTRRVAGNLNGEISLATHADFYAASLRAGWTAGASASQADMTSVTTTTSTIVAAAGSWITKGFVVGDVVRTTGLPDTANNNINLRIIGLTASTMTVAGTTGNAAQIAAPLVANAVADTSFTIAVVGKKVMVPLTGHTDDSFTIEHYFRNAGTSGTVEVFTGCKVNTVDLTMAPNNLATIAIAMMGQNMTTDPLLNGTVPYFTSPTAPTSTAVFSAVSGNLRIGGSDIATVTQLSMQINGNMTGDPVIGSDFLPELFPGRVTVTGEFTAYYRDGSLMANFANEDELSLNFMMRQPGLAPQDFISFNLPRIKLMGADKNDGEGAITQRIPFRALLRAPTPGFDTTTISIQDSSL